jgi:TMEM175 potassium channel family protein
MGKTRLEAFSDGVIAILITVMVLELKVPHSVEPGALVEVWPVFLSYVLSFVYLAIYWNNHHHMLHTVHQVTGGILWANTHLLFWLSLVPFTTGWLGENTFASLPTAVYGVNLLLAAIAYFILQTVIIRTQGTESVLREAVGRDWKGKSSPILYLVAVAISGIAPALSCAIYGVVALMWLVPDSRIERLAAAKAAPPGETKRPR